MNILNRKVTSAIAGVLLLLIGCMVMRPNQAAAIGAWVPLTSPAPNTVGPMLLLSDGSVMCLQTINPHAPSSQVWYRLIPDQYGSYIHGTWTNDIPNMNYAHGLCASAVLPNGKVFVAGGEYPGAAQTTNAEIYDPTAETWTMNDPPTTLFDPGKGDQFSDMISIVIPNGNVLMAPVSPLTSGGTLIFNPKSSSWLNGPVLTNGVGNQDECGWAKLPDGSILTVDGCRQSSQRYIPSLNQWIPDSTAPVSIWNKNGGGCEIGPALTLPNGDVLWVSGTGTNLLYKPSGNATPGSWSTGPVSPGGLQASDVGGAVMVNGKALIILAATCGNGGCYTPWYFYEYDYTLGTANSSLALAPTPTSGILTVPYAIPFMLDLPDGTVLLSSGTSQLNVYQPDGSPIAAWKPTITSITANNDGSFHLIGTGLNGITEGAAEGDDGQMATDYPLVRMTNSSTSQVYYGRTYNWSSTSIQTGSTSESTEFTVPSNLPPGTYNLVVTANGIASDPVTFLGPVWVDFNTPVHPGNGTYATPFYTLALGISAVPTGGTIFIKPGSSTETPTVTKAMTLMSIGGAATVGQ